MTNTTSLDLLLKEIKDPHVQENFYRLKLYLQQLAVGNTTIVNQAVLGPSGGPATSVWEKITTTVPASSLKNIDTILLSSFCQLEYIINFFQTSTGSKKGLKMTVVNDDSTIKEQVYAKTGAPLNVDLNVIVSGPNCLIQIVNNEASVIEVSFAKLNIP